MKTKSKSLIPLLIVFATIITLVIPQFKVSAAVIDATITSCVANETKITKNSTIFNLIIILNTSDTLTKATFNGDGNFDCTNPVGSISGKEITFSGVKWVGDSNTFSFSIEATGLSSITLSTYVREITINNSNVEVVTESDTTTTATSAAGTPAISILKNQTFIVKAGQDTAITIPVVNQEKDTAYSVEGELTDENDVIKVKNVTNKISRATYGNSENLDYILTVPSTVTAGKYPMSLNLTGRNKDGVKYEQTLTVNLEISNNLRAEALDIIEYSIDREAVKSGETFILTVKLQNNCGVDLTNAQIILDGLDGTKFGMNSGLTSQLISIKKGAQTTLQFPLIGCKGIASIREVIPIKLKYQLDPLVKDSVQEVTMNATIPCTVSASNDPDAKVFAPNIIIDNYSFGGDYVVGGKIFPLSMTFRNTSSTATIQNLKVTIQGVAANSGSNSNDTGIAFSPANSSNSFFFQNLGISESQKIDIDFLPRADATPNSYPIQVVFEYEYTENEKKEKADAVTQTITIPLQQDDRFMANSPEIEINSYVGQECPVNLTVVNKGKSAVYNVSVDVEGEGFEKTSTAYYIGNVESGKEEYYDTKIVPNTEGEIKGEIVVTYEDANGTEKEIRKEFMTTAMQMVMDEDMMVGPGSIKDGIIVDDAVDEKKSPVILIGCIAGGTVVVVAGVIITVKVIKRRKLKAEEIEDDNEDI